MKSSSRDCPDLSSAVNGSRSASIASEGSGRAKNSDLANRYGCSGGSACGSTAAPSLPRYAQNRLVSANVMAFETTDVGSDRTSATKRSTSEAASDSPSESAPYTSTDGGRSGSPASVIFRLAASSL